VAAPDHADAIASAKRELRAAARGARAAAFARHGTAAADRLAGHSLSFVHLDPAAVVSGFSAIGDEISALPLLTALGRLGHPLCLPVMQGRAMPLMFRTWSPGSPTREAVWGIQEPIETAPAVEPDVLLVPLLAFDAAGYRLGYGGGFYDRTLEGLRARKRVIAIGLAFDEQRVDSVPHADGDQRLDWILTPSGPAAAASRP